ncbi:MAG TPA: hypothetical protein PKD55_20445, partial [Bellilinea sp.]|nr:hypothetical protein [Bellilinea sp.]
PDRPGQRPAAMDGALANTLALHTVGCANVCRPQRCGSCPTRHEGRFTDILPGSAMQPPCYASKPVPQSAAGAFSPVVGFLTWPVSAGEPWNR